MIVPALALGVFLALAGCATYQSNPVTYEVPFGPAQVRSDFGPSSIVVNGIQDVPVRAGAPAYFQLVSPVNVTLYAFDRVGTGPGGPLLSQLQGTSFYTSVLPTSGTVEFVISATQPVTGGSAQLTVSDSPMATNAGVIAYANPMPGPVPQPPVMISPTSVSIVTGQSVTFTVSGGAGSGGFVWGGAAPATGWSNAYTFNAPGTYTVSAYKSADPNYNQSNEASATVVVAPAVPATAGAAYPAVTVTPVH